MMPERSSWVDYAKGIGIMLVVFGHVESSVIGMGLPGYSEAVHHKIDSILYSFHMPLFFFLSGLFLESSLQKRTVAGLIASKVDSLLYPYIVWSLIQGGLEIFITHGGTSITDVLQFWHPRGQLWFLPILFACFLIVTPMISTIRSVYFGLIWAGFALWYLQKDSGLPDKFPVEAFAGGAVYFVTGILFNQIRGQFIRHSRIILFIALPAFVAAQWAFHFEFNLVYATEHRWAALCLALISVNFIVSLCMQLALLNVSWLEYVGNKSLEIYLMHFIAATFARILMYRFLHIEWASAYLIGATLFAVVAPLCAAVLMDRFGLGFLLAAPKKIRLERLIAQTG